MPKRIVFPSKNGFITLKLIAGEVEVAQLAERPTELFGESSQIVGSELQCFQVLSQRFQVENG